MNFAVINSASYPNTGTGGPYGGGGTGVLVRGC